MRTILNLKMIALDTFDGAVWYELAKDMDLPFAPYPGLKLMLAPIMSDHPDAEKFSEIVQRSSEPATGIFIIDKVLYNVDEERFEVREDKGYENLPTLQQVVEQFIVGYGFIQTWPVADEHIS